MKPTVCVTIVTYHSRRYIERCLSSVFAQTHLPLEIVIVDNASSDGTREILAAFGERVRVLYNATNLGFAAAQNQAIAASKSDWVLVLNPDVVLAPDFIEQLLEQGAGDSRIGTLCGRLLSCDQDMRRCNPPVIDTAGMHFTPAMRHFDRGWKQPDDGRYRELEYVFGASAAAALYRRRMIEAISEAGEFFDPDFFAYREDADVAWRAQLLGWRCLYVPDAEGIHVRTVGPRNRRRVARLINMHSVKNRFLMRIKNMTGGVYRRYWWPILMRDLLVVAGCLLWEQSSLPAFWHVIRITPRALRRRRWILERKAVSDDTIARWFLSSATKRRALERALPGFVNTSSILVLLGTAMEVLCRQRT